MICPILKADEKAIIEAVKTVAKGEVIAVPTETVYGIIADATQERAVKRLRGIKQRDGGQPFQVLVQNLNQALEIADFSRNARKLAGAFWPGPLTLIVPEKVNSRSGSTRVVAEVSAGSGTLGLRSPDSYIIQEILQEVARPLAASSANISGEETPNTAKGVQEVMGRKLSLILDYDMEVGCTPSTIVDIRGGIKILREGIITKGQIEECVGK